MASLAGGPLWSGDTRAHRERVHRLAHARPEDLPPGPGSPAALLARDRAEAEAIRNTSAAERKRRERERLDALHAEKEAERIAAEPIPCTQPEQLDLGGLTA